MSTKETGTLSSLGRELGQFLLVCLLGFATLRLVEQYWQEPITMLAGASVIFAAMLLVKRNLAITLTGLGVGVLGPLAEMQGVAAGAWSYAQPNIEGVPAWLFLVWGTAGIFVVSACDFLRELIDQVQRHGSGDGQ